MSGLYHWTFKYNGKQWKVTAWAAGRKPVMCSPGELDRVWGWGIWAGRTPKLIASGEITGQLDELPHLSAILLDWQAMIAGAVVAAIETAKPGHEHPAEQRTGEV